MFLITFCGSFIMTIVNRKQSIHRVQFENVNQQFENVKSFPLFNSQIMRDKVQLLG